MYSLLFSGKLAPRTALGLGVGARAYTRLMMYEEHFGLSKNPFQSIAEGEAVYEGPEQQKIIAGLKTALTQNDSIAVVTGPVGVGKTTIVQRAIEEAAPERLVARLGRTAIGSDELVDLLLAQFGVVREPTRRFECLKTFNRILNDHAASGARVFIVIEDAERLGADLLEELEALTAADGGDCAGANIVLMGPQKLDKLVTKPALERLRQRIRLQKTLERFNAEEVEAYLRHRIGAAGGNYDTMFEKGSALMVRRCSGGIPRVINGLCETALNVTEENQMTQVTPKIIFKVAVEVFGMAPGEGTGAPTPQTAPAAQAATPAARPAAAAADSPQATAPASKAPEPAATTPAPSAKSPKPATTPVAKAAAAQAPKAPAPKQAPAPELTADPTIPVAKVPAAIESKPQAPIAPRAPKPPAKPGIAAPAATNGATAPAATPQASRIPDLSGLGVQDKAPASAEKKPTAAKPLPELPPKFKFADEIVVDKDTKPSPPPEQKKADPPELPTLNLDDGPPKVADKKPDTPKVPEKPSAAPEQIPTLGDSARVEKIEPKKPIAAPKPAAPKPKPEPVAAKAPPVEAKPKPIATKAPRVEAKPVPEVSLEEPNPPAARSEPKADEATASFAKVDHDMLDAALASLAVHDEEDGPPAEALALHEPEPAPVVEEPTEIPEVTLDKSIEAGRPTPDPAELDKMAAELEQTKTLEEMSDKLAETLFGSEELEAISMQIREQVAPEESPVALETTEAAAPDAPTAAAPLAPEMPKAPEPPAAPIPPKSPPVETDVEMSSTPAAAPAANAAPQPEPIENQFNTSMTATLKTLNNHSKPPVDDDDDDEESSGGLLGRLKNTFRS